MPRSKKTASNPSVPSALANVPKAPANPPPPAAEVDASKGFLLIKVPNAGITSRPSDDGKYTYINPVNGKWVGKRPPSILAVLEDGTRCYISGLSVKNPEPKVEAEEVKGNTVEERIKSLSPEKKAMLLALLS